VAITPATDIVLDVARAADPERYRAALERLARLRAGADVSPPPAFTPNPPVANTANPPAQTTPGARSRRQLDPYGQFEAFVLQSFLQSMMPRNATSVYGRGSAGEFWRSMLAEKLGDELARSGQVGIARRLSAGSGATQSPPANDANAAAPPPLVSTLNHTNVPAPNPVQNTDAPPPTTGERS